MGSLGTAAIGLLPHCGLGRVTAYVILIVGMSFESRGATIVVAYNHEKQMND
jgi:hypothetical protein